MDFRKILVTVMEFALHLYCPSMFAHRWQQLAQQSCRSRYHTAMSEKRPNGRNLSLPVKCDIDFFICNTKVICKVGHHIQKRMNESRNLSFEIMRLDC